MTTSKVLHEGAESDFAVKLEELEKMLQNARTNLEPLKPEVKKHLQSSHLQQIENANLWIEKCSSSVTLAKQNLDSVTDILNLRKASYEVKEVVVRSWPKRSLTERLSYISTALFPIGGTPFILTGGEVTEAALATAAVIWSMAGILLLGSLGHLFLDDREKWKYFKREFDLEISKNRATGKANPSSPPESISDHH